MEIRRKVFVVAIHAYRSVAVITLLPNVNTHGV